MPRKHVKRKPVGANSEPQKSGAGDPKDPQPQSSPHPPPSTAPTTTAPPATAAPPAESADTEATFPGGASSDGSILSEAARAARSASAEIELNSDDGSDGEDGEAKGEDPSPAAALASLTPSALVTDLDTNLGDGHGSSSDETTLISSGNDGNDLGMFIKYFSLYSVYIQCEGFAKLTFSDFFRQ
jgi:hypothetical protein